MLDFDTELGAGGSPGPWVRWQAEGTKNRVVPLNAFSIREKPEGADKSVVAHFRGFDVGVALDLDSVKQGWQKDNGFGQAPSRDFSSRKRPSEEKRRTDRGGETYVWAQMFSCRIAYDGGKKAATWEDASWGGYEGFRRLIVTLKAELTADPNKAALSPVIKQAAVEQRTFASGPSVVPVFEIVKWVPKPAILSAPSGVAAFEATPAAPPAPPAPPPPPPAPAADLDEF